MQKTITVVEQNICPVVHIHMSVNACCVDVRIVRPGVLQFWLEVPVNQAGPYEYIKFYLLDPHMTIPAALQFVKVLDIFEGQNVSHCVAVYREPMRRTF